MKKHTRLKILNNKKYKKYKISSAYKGIAAAGIVFVAMVFSSVSYGAASNNTTHSASNVTQHVGASSAQAASLTAAVTMRTEAVAGQISTRPAAPQRGAAGVTVSGEIPQANLTGPGTLELNAQLNRRFVIQRDNFLQAHRARTPEMEFSTSVYKFNEYVSVVVRMYAIGANTTRAVETTVINTAAMQIVDLADQNPNMLNLINTRINNDIAANPRLFVPSFEGVMRNHPFYIEGGALHVLFDAGTLHSGHRQISTYTFKFSSIQNELIGHDMFFVATDDQYNTMMVNLKVAETFGYKVYRTGNNVNLVREDSGASFVIGQNSFSANGITRALEAAPIVRGGSIYAPLSFFSQMLEIATTVINEYELFMSQWKADDLLASTLGATPALVR